MGIWSTKTYLFTFRGGLTASIVMVLVIRIETILLYTRVEDGSHLAVISLILNGTSDISFKKLNGDVLKYFPV